MPAVEGVQQVSIRAVNRRVLSTRGVGEARILGAAASTSLTGLVNPIPVSARLQLSGAETARPNRLLHQTSRNPAADAPVSVNVQRQRDQ